MLEARPAILDEQVGRLSGALVDVLFQARGGAVGERGDRQQHHDGEHARQEPHEVGRAVHPRGEQGLVALDLVDVRRLGVRGVRARRGVRGALRVLGVRALLLHRLFSVLYHQSPPARWWHAVPAQGGIRVRTRGGTVCPKRRRGASRAHARERATLSVEWGRMGRMSQESLPSDGGPEHPDALPEYAERVLEVTELIPPGRVMTYGDVAEWLEEGGPRQVGRVMALYGGAVPWWRVVRADGVLLPGHELRALGHYRAEGHAPEGGEPGPRRAMCRASTEARAVGGRWAHRRSHLTASALPPVAVRPPVPRGEAEHIRGMTYVREARDMCGRSARREEAESLLPHFSPA
ncbi:hypothetical protein GCM10023238_38710 [Streptomyces heliomycini]